MSLAGPVLVAAGCGGTGPSSRRTCLTRDSPSSAASSPGRSPLNPRAGDHRPLVVETRRASCTPPASRARASSRSSRPSCRGWRVRGPASSSPSPARRSGARRAARRLGRAPGLSAIEVPVSGEPFHAASLVSAVARDLPRGVPVLAKIRPDLLRVVGPHVPSRRRRRRRGGRRRAARGPADGRPAGCHARDPAGRAALRHRGRAALPDAPVVGGGGIMTADDARSFLAAGAVAVRSAPHSCTTPTAAHLAASSLHPARSPEDSAP